MEDEPLFQQVKRKLDGLDNILNESSHDDLLEVEQQLHQDIDLQFSITASLLEERREALKKQTTDFIQQTKRKRGEDKEKTRKAAEDCKQILDWGISIYPTRPAAAIHIWKSVSTINESSESDHKVSVKFSNAVEDAILTHGEVVYPSSSSSPLPSSSKSKKRKTQNVTFKAIEAAPPINNNLTLLKVEKLDLPFDITDGVLNTFDDEGKRKTFKKLMGITFNHESRKICVCDKEAVYEVNRKGKITWDGPFHQPFAVAHDPFNNFIYVSFPETHVVQRISDEGVVQPCCGDDFRKGMKDGSGNNSTLFNPRGMAVDPNTGDAYVADAGNHAIRKITFNRNVTTLVGKKDSPFESLQGMCYSKTHQALIVCDIGKNKLFLVKLTGEVYPLCDAFGPLFVQELPDGSVLYSSHAHKKIYKVVFNGDSIMAEVVAGETIKFTSVGGITVDIASNICYFSGDNSIRTIKF